MGKIYEALQRSGKVIGEKNFTNRTFNEDGLTPLEKKVLGRAGRHYVQKNPSITASSQNLRIPSSKKIDSLLMDLGLSKAQISRQGVKELNRSLRRIDSCIARPQSFLKQNFRDTVNSETNFKLNILPVLFERRMFVLESYAELVAKVKNDNLRRLIQKISDTDVKSSIEKILDDLQKKISVLKKEYQKIEKARQDIYVEQQKFLSMPEKPSERANKTSKILHAREPAATWIMGALLILIALVIAIAPFANISVPDILFSAFLIILGFFFGQGFGRLANYAEKN